MLNSPKITLFYLLSTLLNKVTDDDMDMISSIFSLASENILWMMQITGEYGNKEF